MAAKDPVRATRVDDAVGSSIPGAYQFVDGAVLLVCPCGCGGLMRLSIYSEGTVKGKTPSWSWNGDQKKPTLRPSIRDVGSCYFHGWLTEGLWTFAGDSGVKPEKRK